MISAGLLLIAGALALPTGVFYMQTGPTPKTMSQGVAQIGAAAGLIPLIAGGIFILSGGAMLLGKLSRSAHGLIGLLVVLSSIALFVSSYFIGSTLSQYPTLLSTLQEEIQIISADSKFVPTASSLITVIQADINFLQYGVPLTASAGVAGILALGLKHGLKI